MFAKNKQHKRKEFFDSYVAFFLPLPDSTHPPTSCIRFKLLPKAFPSNSAKPTWSLATFSLTPVISAFYKYRKSLGQGESFKATPDIVNSNYYYLLLPVGAY